MSTAACITRPGPQVDHATPILHASIGLALAPAGMRLMVIAASISAAVIDRNATGGYTSNLATAFAFNAFAFNAIVFNAFVFNAFVFNAFGLDVIKVGIAVVLVGIVLGLWRRVSAVTSALLK